MLNTILAAGDPIAHCGPYAALLPWSIRHLPVLHNGRFVARVHRSVAHRILAIEPGALLMQGHRVALWIRDPDTLTLLDSSSGAGRPSKFIAREHLPGHDWRGIDGTPHRTESGSRCFSHLPNAFRFRDAA